MPPQSRGPPTKPLPLPAGFQSRSTPNLPTLKSLSPLPPPNPNDSPSIVTSPAPSEPTSLEDFALDPASTDDDDDDDDASSSEDDTARMPPPPRPLYQQTSRSQSHLALSAFAPPFYNRPPTPLPPSPSLTSLLRPNFSSANSRPSTPDPSSDEGAGHHHAGTATPASATTTTTTTGFPKPEVDAVPRASPKVPTYEYYGFTLYLTSSLCFLAYILWAYLPSPFLHQLGIYYYPNRWWALAVPAWCVMAILYIYVALASYNTGYLTLGLGSVECLVDEAGSIAVVDGVGRLVRGERASWMGDEQLGGKRASMGGSGRRSAGPSRRGSFSKLSSAMEVELDWRNLWNEGTDAVMDIPIGGVCEVLYGGR